MIKKSLSARKNDLAKTTHQLDVLSNGIFASGELPSFAKKIQETNQFPLHNRVAFRHIVDRLGEAEQLLLHLIDHGAATVGRLHRA